jgi:outer membrane protein insertion porin family
MRKFFFIALFLVFNSFSLAKAGEKISDIKVEGLQRIDPGLVFNNLPFEINDDFESVNFSKAISLLYKTGQFKNIVIEQEGNVIIVSVKEKPILFELNFSGTEIFQPEALKEALNQMNISPGLILDESDLRRAEKEIESQYLSQGKYTANVKSEIIPLANNKVNVNFYIDEGRISRIKEISIFGNKTYKTEDLIDQLQSKTTNFMSWWNKDDRYSRQILSGDLEKIKSYYMDRGYLDFKITSSIVSISKNKKNVYVAISLEEGKKYSIGKIYISGELPEKVDFKDVEKQIKVSTGEIFNRKLINESSQDISKLLGNYGYAFANVNAIPSINNSNLTVDFNFNVDQGKKIYVRRVNILGNESTKDEVVRREIRQYESSWFSQEKIELSKNRLNRTQYFESVNIETQMVSGTSDQVDLNILLKETNTGKFQIGAGVSSSEGVVGTLSLSQGNFLGTGNLVQTELSLGGINKVWSLNYIDPYWTDDGVSRGFGIYFRDIDTKELNTGDYKSNNYGLSMDFGIPLDEFRSFKFGTSLDFTKLDLKSNSPQKFLNYCASLDGAGSTSCSANSLLFYTSWIDNTINNPIIPTNGHKLSLTADVTAPGLDLEYYKLYAKGEKYFPLSSTVTTKVKAAIGFGDSYGDDPFPFFKNFRVGGKSTVRGFKEGSVGKKTYDSNSEEWVTYGGDKMFSFGVETFFPIPFVKSSDGYRLSLFIDAGAAFEDSFNGSDIRYSAGIGGLWISPFGPLNVSFGVPLNEGDHDQTESFQFGMGSSF